ncbi:hypothetical protein JCM24511_08117 [Saitozyma sp. JCM 24511]|nr:hypothetical protein JCM24511_08117 [Saitozyma sp. JCM 24511]
MATWAKLSSGLDDGDIKLLGRWSSEAVKLYQETPTAQVAQLARATLRPSTSAPPGLVPTHQCWWGDETGPFRCHLAATLYRECKWAYLTSSDLVVVASRDMGTTYSLSLAQGVGQGDPLGPLMHSLGIRQLLDGLTSTLGRVQLILAYLDDIYILCNYPKAPEDVQPFFATR